MGLSEMMVSATELNKSDSFSLKKPREVSEGRMHLNLVTENEQSLAAEESRRVCQAGKHQVVPA
jgi:hypothetical protein